MFYVMNTLSSGVRQEIGRSAVCSALSRRPGDDGSLASRFFFPRSEIRKKRVHKLNSRRRMIFVFIDFVTFYFVRVIFILLFTSYDLLF